VDRRSFTIIQEACWEAAEGLEVLLHDKIVQWQARSPLATGNHIGALLLVCCTYGTVAHAV
jgi:hypothetical protein